MDTMLDFRIDSEVAVVTVSSVALEGERLVAAAEFVRKVEPHSLTACRHGLAIEWTAALTKLGTSSMDSYMSPAKTDYWEEPARKIRRVDSDPKSPEHK